MTFEQRRHRSHPAPAVWLLLAGGLWAAACNAAASGKQPIEVDAGGRELCGALSRYDGLRVLELWGSPEEAGFAQGYLLAADIVVLFDEYLLDPRIIPTPQIYEQQLLPEVRRRFDWPADARVEIEAVLRGIQARLPAEERVPWRLNRELTVDDLLVANAFADFFGAMCSSFTAWGGLTADGRVLTGRNLDFPFTDTMAEAQIVVVRHGFGTEPPHVSVTWPAMVGVFTAMNSSGVTILMHDAGGLPSERAGGFTPRALILREALAAARPESFAADVQAVLARRRVMIGNNIHVSGPAEGSRAAVVFEYDGNPQGEGVTPRTAAATAGAVGGAVPEALFNTNHMCLRRPPQPCRRYAGFEQLLGGHAAERRPVDVARVFEILHEVRQDMTLHSVCAEPAVRRLHVRIPAIHGRVVTFSLADWLGGELADGRARGGGGRE